MLDTTHPVETPEGVGIDLILAGPPSRSLAWMIDFAIKIGVLLGLGFVLSLFQAFGIAVLLVVFFLMEWFYPVFFEVYWHGQTPGKRALGIAVVYQDGTPVGWRGSLLRNLLRAADMLPVLPIGAGLFLPLYGFGLFTALFNRRFQRLGDLIAGTVVVYEESRATRGEDFPETKPAAPPIPLQLSEQRALISFAERATRLPEGRQAELGDILKPLTGKSGMNGVAALRSYAAWFTGSRG